MADVLDIVNIDEAKQAVNLDPSLASDNEDVLARWVTAISRRIDKLCGPVVARTVTAEQHAGGEDYIAPRYRPVYSVTSISEYSGTTAQALAAENFPTVTSYDYWVDPVTSYIYRRNSGYGQCFAGTRVIITYQAGRYTTTATVDALFKGACEAILRRLWERESPVWARGGNADIDTAGVGFFRVIDPMVDELLATERQYGFA